MNRWWKENYGNEDERPMTFSEVFAEKRQKGRASLRRSQFRLAEKNATMAIWLGKQYLGQKDQVEASVAVDTAKEDALSKSLREMAEELESDAE